jgi:regulator of RNase E activity RraA
VVPADERKRAAALFVDAARGDDAAAGTEKAPWKTLGHALKQLKPGDTLYLRGGTYYEKVRLSQSGTADGPIVIASYPGEMAIIDGGLRDLNEFLPWKDFPVYYRGAHASAMADLVGVEWNVPVRIGDVTVLPGDVVIGDESGLLFFPPQLADEAIQGALDSVYTETFKREMIRSGKYRTSLIYPKLSPELEKVFEEWKKTHPRP